MERVTRLNEFMHKIGSRGGMSLSTGYDLEFDFSVNNNPKGFVEEFYTDDARNVVNMMCDEAQLPNVVSTTGTVIGRYLGEGLINYPHTRTYTDLGLGFMCDAEQIPLKFLTSWYDFMYGENVTSDETYDGTMEAALGSTPRPRNRTNRLKFPDEYVCNLKIMKTEPNKNSSSGRVPITYILENCYPYSIDAVPLAYGSSQLSRVTASFYYTRHTVLYGSSNQGPELDPDDPAFGNFGLNRGRVGDRFVQRGG